MNNQEEPIQATPPRTITVEEDPFEKSFDDSAIQYIPYKIFLLIIALGFLQLGKSSLPEDSVPCIEDVVNDAFAPVANFFNNDGRGFGLTLMTIMQLICDIQLVGMVIYWIIWGKSFTYPLAVGFLGISKVIINALFKTRDIEGAFKDRVFLSLMFGENFQNTYFFSGITAFFVMNLLEFWKNGYKKLFYAQIIIMVYVMFLLTAMKLNFFMDIITALAFGYTVYSLFYAKKEAIDSFLLNPKQTINKWLGKDEQSSTSSQQN